MTRRRTIDRRQWLCAALAAGLTACRSFRGSRVDVLPVPTPWPLGPFRWRELPSLEPRPGERLTSPNAVKLAGRIHLFAIEAGALVHAVSDDGERFERRVTDWGSSETLLDLRVTAREREVLATYRTLGDPDRIRIARLDEALSELHPITETPAGWRPTATGLLLPMPDGYGQAMIVPTAEGLHLATSSRLMAWPSSCSPLALPEDLPAGLRPGFALYARQGVQVYATTPTDSETPRLTALILATSDPRTVLAARSGIDITDRPAERSLEEAGGLVRFQGRWLAYATGPAGSIHVLADE
ncbi:MAG: hypothetical protein RL885_00975 [Planctomycetota bacterium]